MAWYVIFVSSNLSCYNYAVIIGRSDLSIFNSNHEENLGLYTSS